MHIVAFGGGPGVWDQSKNSIEVAQRFYQNRKSNGGSRLFWRHALLPLMTAFTLCTGEHSASDPPSGDLKPSAPWDFAITGYGGRQGRKQHFKRYPVWLFHIDIAGVQAAGANFISLLSSTGQASLRWRSLLTKSTEKQPGSFRST
ncbi:hypothetical protein GGR01_002269 [Acetobacter oeni]|nr:hypothetical protein [Acetobacter oeni]